MADEKRGAPRVGAVLRIRLAFGSMDDFVERYAMNISSGGIFVRTRDPSPPGTELGLDVAIQSGDQVISGRGVVRWTTPPSAPGEPHRDPGMGIRFLELTPESRALVDLVVATQGAAARSEEPPLPEEVDLAAGHREGSEAPAGVAPAPPASAGAPAPAPSPERSRLRPVAGPVVGIDLGTTNALVAFAKEGRATVLRCRQGSTTVPAIVAYDPHGRLLVGQPAKAQVIVNPHHTVYGAKRLVGRPFASPTVQACRDRFPYEIVEAPGGAAAVRFAGRDYTLQQIAALVLAEMKECATQVLGEPVERAVVTVPAHYDDHQRNAVHEAGRLAGLHVERIVNEPTAAALAYGHGKALQSRVLVYDLGGGTFDASVLEIRGDAYEVVSTGGDTFLGGLDFDAQLVDHLVFRFMEDHGFAPPEDRAVWQRIRDAAEETKIALSTRERAIAHVPYLCKGEDGKEVDLSVEVTRSELEALTGRLVERTLEVCRDVLAAKHLRPADVDEVLLVGGQSRMPLVWRKVAAELGREPNAAVHPDEAVALGAALLGESIGSAGSIVLIDALAMGIGVGLPGGRMATVLARNTALPARKAYELATTRDGQTELELHVFQGNSAKASECEYLGTVQFRDLPAREKGAVRIAVEFALGAEGLLTVTGTDSESGRASVARLATHDTPESLREKLGFPESPTAPRGARPIDPAPASRPAKRGFFGRLFGARG
ncbi:MAG TPA: TIGR02266 family protein [Anaeromyxobacter sp.]